LIHASTEILRDAYDPTHDSRELLGRAEDRIFAIHDQKGTGELKSMNEVLHETFDQIDKWMLEGRSTGIPSGFTDIDDLTGGLHPSELLILAARPSMGKTSLAMNFAERVTLHPQNPRPVLFVSLEMARMELAQRMLCSYGKIDGRKFRKGMISPAERDQLVEASNDLSKAALFIDDSPSRTITEIAATARRLKRRENLGLLIIDYLQLIEPDNSKDPRQEQVAKIARRLKGLARELSVPVLCLAQLNRQVEASRDNKPQLSHLRESGAIEQDADVVMFVHREEYYMSNEEDRERVRGEADLLVRKQRNGPTGDVKLAWIHDFTRFRNFSHKTYEEFDQYGGEF
jgi:replicative DNA helicase